MNEIKNISILASAGTGKTFQLSDRIVRLLASGQVKPSEIAALTFTRAAAAEFIIKVISKLKGAAENTHEHFELCKRIGLDSQKYNQEYFLDLLKKTLLASNQIMMGTLDSFFAKLVNNFPLEVGLNTGVAKTVPDHEADTHRIEALQSVLKDQGKAESIFNNLREYRDNSDVVNPIESLVKMVKDYHGLFMIAQDEEIWGNTRLIFGNDTPPWFGCSEKFDPTEYLENIKVYLDNLEKREPKPFTTLLEISRSKSLKNKDVDLVIEFFNVILNAPSGVESSYVFNSKPVAVSAKVAESIRSLIHRAIDVLFKTRIKQTRALYRSLNEYEKVYDQAIRRMGLLGYSDYVTLITEADPFKKEQMQFRLDCTIKHWLLDEFQDTSTLQYGVLKRNIDEIIASPPEDRSVFVVGDLKQSLYQWRSGNLKLLSDLNDQIGNNKEWGENIKLNKTRRCSAVVLEMVNAVLGNHEGKKLGRFYSEIACQAWSKNFQEQEAENQKQGESLWVELEMPKGSDIKETEAQAIWIAEHLKSTPGILTEKVNGNQRLKPGLTCAVLVSKNSLAAQITEVLRKNGIEATDEAKASVIKDNPVTFSLICLIQATIHPDNQFAKGTCEISPASKQIIQTIGSWDKTAELIAATFSESGAEGLINFLISKLEIDSKNKFIFKRFAQLRSLAVQYDVKGDRDLPGFADFIENTEMRDSADPQTVQVITIHRSKGLEYDMVYMPCLNDSDHIIAELRRADLIQLSDAEFKPKWLLTNPGEGICEYVSQLKGPMNQAKAENAYGNLCRLYVGMTRAKHRLVMISRTLSDAGQKDFDKGVKGKHDFACLLKSTLTERTPTDSIFENTWPAKIVWQSHKNSMDWIQVRLNEESKKSTAKLALRKLSIPKFKPVTAIEKLRPSESKHAQSWKPTNDKVGGKALGSVVHSLFERHTTNTKEFLAEINKPSSAPSSPLYTSAIKLVNKCLKSKDVVDLLDGRTAEMIVWREQKAALQHEGKMIDAVFDRVHIIPGKAAVIIDYKTNTCSEAELKELYEGQMNLYRKSISKLCGLPENKVRCILIHVRNGSLVEV
jgi:ATP-dependent exoDNAse (exonuclease V) beta subunit